MTGDVQERQITSTVTVLEEDDAEYQSLLAKLDQEFPTVASPGFDFKRIGGNIGARTAKAIVLHLSLRGWSPEKIGESIEVPARAVNRYLYEAMLEATPPDDLDALRNFELAKLTEMERSCWEQFERSCSPEESETREYHASDDPDDPDAGEVIKRTRKGQSGNPTYKKVLIDISKRRAALLGLDAPTRHEVDKTERKLTINVVEVKTREEALAAKAAGLLK